MQHIPGKGSEEGVSFTLADFLKAGEKELSLTVHTGKKGLNHEVLVPIMNRPGLALTGFFEHYAWDRLQVFGNAEVAYLRATDDYTHYTRLKGLFERKTYCVICTNGIKPPPKSIALAKEYGAVMMSTPMPTSKFTYQSAFVLEKLGAPRTSIYGTMLEVNGLGVMIEGDPGLGKSETALGLIKRGYSLIADDLTCIRKDVANNCLFGSASQSTAGFMEIRGIGIMHVPSVFGISAIRGEKRLQLVLTFKRLAEVKGEIDRIGQTRRVRTILGVDIPNIIIPVSEGRDLVNLVETATYQQKLIMSGFNPVEVLSERLRCRAEEQPKGKRAKNG